MKKIANSIAAPETIKLNAAENTYQLNKLLHRVRVQPEVDIGGEETTCRWISRFRVSKLNDGQIKTWEDIVANHFHFQVIRYVVFAFERDKAVTSGLEPSSTRLSRSTMNRTAIRLHVLCCVGPHLVAALLSLRYDLKSWYDTIAATAVVLPTIVVFINSDFSFRGTTHAACIFLGVIRWVKKTTAYFRL